MKMNDIRKNALENAKKGNVHGWNFDILVEMALEEMEKKNEKK